MVLAAIAVVTSFVLIVDCERAVGLKVIQRVRLVSLIDPYVLCSRAATHAEA